MHRSGTSFTTRAINLLGARVGNNLFERSESNPRGFWEHGFPVHINKRLLELAGGRWDEPPGDVEDVEFGHLTRFRMRLFLGRLHNGDVNTAVWKDPRTLLTFPLWKEEMINYVPVFVFRHPMSVATAAYIQS